MYYPEPNEPLLSKATAERLLEGDPQANWDALATSDPHIAKDYRALKERIGVHKFLEWVRDDEGVVSVANAHGEAKELTSACILLKGDFEQHDAHSFRNRFMETGVS